MIIGGCGMCGFSAAASHRREEQGLRQLMNALDYMQCELLYRMTPLPDLCRMAGVENRGSVGMLFTTLAVELESQICPDVESCMRVAMGKVGNLPKRTEDALRLLGNSLGRFDAEGQINGMEAVRTFCRENLQELTVNRESRLRSYQTLGLCAGAALAILFV